MSPEEIEAISRAGKIEALKEAAIQCLYEAIEQIKEISKEGAFDRAAERIRDTQELIEETQLE